MGCLACLWRLAWLPLAQNRSVAFSVVVCWALQRPNHLSVRNTNVELPLCTGGRCHKWRILLRRSYTSSMCMIPFVSCCEKDRKIIYSYIIEVHMLWSVQKDNVKQRREDIERIKSQPSNAWYFKSKSRNPRTMKRQGRKYPLQLKNTTTSTCFVALTQHAGFPWFQRKTIMKPRASFFKILNTNLVRSRLYQQHSKQNSGSFTLQHKDAKQYTLY